MPRLRAATKTRLYQLELSLAGGSQNLFPANGTDDGPSSPGADSTVFPLHSPGETMSLPNNGHSSPGADSTVFRAFSPGDTEIERSPAREPSSSTGRANSREHENEPYSSPGADGLVFHTEQSLQPSSSRNSPSTVSLAHQRLMSPENDLNEQNTSDTQATRPLPRLNGLDGSNSTPPNVLRASQYFPAPTSSEIGEVNQIIPNMSGDLSFSDDNQSVRGNGHSQATKSGTAGAHQEPDHKKAATEDTIIVSDEFSISEDYDFRSEGESEYCPSESEAPKSQKKSQSKPAVPGKAIKKLSMGTLSKTSAGPSTATNAAPNRPKEANPPPAQANSQVQSSATQNLNKKTPVTALPKRITLTASSRVRDQNVSVAMPSTKTSGKQAASEAMAKPPFEADTSRQMNNNIIPNSQPFPNKKAKKAAPTAKRVPKKSFFDIQAEGPSSEIREPIRKSVVPESSNPKASANMVETKKRTRKTYGSDISNSLHEEPELMATGDVDDGVPDGSPEQRKVQSTMNSKSSGNKLTKTTPKLSLEGEAGVAERSTQPVPGKKRPGKKNVWELENSPEPSALKPLTTKRRKTIPQPERTDEDASPAEEQGHTALASKGTTGPNSKKKRSPAQYGTNRKNVKRPSKSFLEDKPKSLNETLAEDKLLPKKVPKPKNESSPQEETRPEIVHFDPQRGPARPTSPPVDRDDVVDSEGDFNVETEEVQNTSVRLQEEIIDRESAQDNTFKLPSNRDISMVDAQESPTEHKQAEDQDSANEPQDFCPPIEEDNIALPRRKRSVVDHERVHPAAKKTKHASSTKTPARPVVEKTPSAPHAHRHVTVHVRDSGSPVPAVSDGPSRNFLSAETEISEGKAVTKLHPKFINKVHHATFEVQNEQSSDVYELTEAYRQPDSSRLGASKQNLLRRLTQPNPSLHGSEFVKSHDERSPFVAGTQYMDKDIAGLHTSINQHPSSSLPSKQLMLELPEREPFPEVDQKRAKTARLNHFRLQGAASHPQDSIIKKHLLTSKPGSYPVPPAYDDTKPSVFKGPRTQKLYKRSDDPFCTEGHEYLQKGTSSMPELPHDSLVYGENKPASQIHPRSPGFARGLPSFLAAGHQSDLYKRGKAQQPQESFRRSKLPNHYGSIDTSVATGLESMRGRLNSRMPLRYENDRHLRESSESDRPNHWEDAVDSASSGVAEIVHTITSIILRQLKSREAALASVIDEYKRNGRLLIKRLLGRQSRERDVAFDQFRERCLHLTSVYDNAAKTTKAFGDDLSSKTIQLSQVSEARHQEYSKIRKAIIAFKEDCLDL